MSDEYRLPALPLGGPQVTLLRWLKRPGDRLSPGDPLLLVANERAEIVFPVAGGGIFEAALVAEGATVTVGMPLARIAPVVEAHVNAVAAATSPRRITPVARRIAELADIDITLVVGTGPGGCILKRDVLALHNDRPPPTNDGSHTTVSPMRRAIAEHMLRSRSTAPHALTAMEVDMSRVAATRARWRVDFARRGVDLTYTACIALAAVAALSQHSLLNSSWSDVGIILRRRVHLGVAVALPDGLITPVIREAQDLNLRGMARALADVARRARARALRPGEAAGGTFTITNPGAGALWFGTPIIAQPQSAILGVGVVRPHPLVISAGGVDRIVVRPAALLTLAYDARVLGQQHADAFLRDVKRALEHFDM
jgi:pyruvate/2-oxoglutarate dehydrogenase complex dihydrolipoamide acyltransferase (E2) component